LTNTHGQRTYLVAVLSALVNVWFSGMRLPLSVLVSLDFKRSVPALRSTWSYIDAGVISGRRLPLKHAFRVLVLVWSHVQEHFCR
jgi:hypothetical protein